MLFLCVLLAGVSFGVNSGQGALHFASYYQDHIVLQKGPQRAVIWGHAMKIGDTVTVQVSYYRPVTGEVTKDVSGKGIWKVKLPVINEEGPFTVTATSSEGTVAIEDVLFGDVWICSGQSNMELPVRNTLNSAEEVWDSLQYKHIRIMSVSDFQSDIPLRDFPRSSAINWTQPTIAAVRGFSAVCWFFGKYLYDDVHTPIGLIESDWGATPIEAWSSPEALAVCPRRRVKRGPKQRSVLWNAMINPLLGLTIYGVIWYQGEGNRPRPELYACQFPALINDWRQKFHDGSLGETSADFPFGFVQLAAYRRNRTIIGRFPPVRWSQTAKYGDVPNELMQNVFMAVEMDLPDNGRIHPRNKQEVARRLVLGARAVAYNESTVKYRGPIPKRITENATSHTLHIVFAHGPIEVRDVNGFEVCCSALSTTCGSNGTWRAAPIHFHQTFDLLISTSACGIQHAVGVRYAWRETPCDVKKCAIYGAETSLPAPPYIYTGGFEKEA